MPLVCPISLLLLHLMSTYFRGISAFTTSHITPTILSRTIKHHHHPTTLMMATTVTEASNSTTSSTSASLSTTLPPPPLYISEGLIAIHKPLTWTSQDVVGYIRGILTRDAKDRGYDEDSATNNNNSNGKKKRNRKKKPLLKVGHGGTLDPLASGVLVLGIGKGTSQLQDYLKGDKQYVAAVQLGYETDTLDAEGKVVKSADFDHITSIEDEEKKIMHKFVGKIEQIPPLYSAIRVGGKRLYEIARKADDDEDDTKAEDVEIPKREVEIYSLSVGSSLEDRVVKSGVVDGRRYKEEVAKIEEAEVAKALAAKVAAAAAAAEAATEEDGLTKEEVGSDDDDEPKSKRTKRKRNKKNQKKKSNFKKSPFNDETVPSITSDNAQLELPQFTLSVSCGGGTYIRSLVRDIGYELDTVATMTGLVRTKQGPFVLEDALTKEDWTADKIYAAIRKI